MIKTSNSKLIRQTKAQWEYEDGTEIKSAEITVKYFGRTTKEFREQREEIYRRVKEDPNFVLFHSDTLLKRLHSLPDLGDEEGKTLKITQEWLDAQDLKNLQSLVTAIEEDESPKSMTSN
jgi:hypothetical protein